MNASTLLAVVVLHAGVLLSPQAAANDLRIQYKSCSRLTLRAIDRTGGVIRFTADGKGWIFSVRSRLLEHDPDPQTPIRAGALVSGDRRLRITAHPDGLLRWTSTATRGQRLALCMEAATQEWVAFTPGGYYESSSSGDRLVGWQRPEEGPTDFFPFALLRKHFYRPQIVSRMLSSTAPESDIAAVLSEQGDRMSSDSVRHLLPPLLKVLWPLKETSVSERQLTLKAVVRSVSGLPAVLRVSTSTGAPVEVAVASQSEEPKEPDGKKRDRDVLQNGSASPNVTIDLEIPAGDSTIEVVALSPQVKTESEPEAFRLTWKGRRIPPEKPDVYVLAIGVGKYRDERLQRLDYAAKDAQDFTNALLSQRGRSYRNVEAVGLRDNAATREDIISKLKWLQDKPMRANDLAVLFLAGHGMGSEELGSYYYLPYDAVRADPTRTMLDAATLQEFLAKRKGGRALVFIDTCHSGNMFSNRDTLKDLAREISRSGNVVVYTSSTGGQVSLEWKKWGNGAFTKAVIEGFQGAADQDGSGELTVTLLEYYVSQRVKQLTDDQQTPTSAKPSSISDFQIAKVHVPLLRRRWFRWTGVGVLAGALVTAGIVFGTQYHPDPERGNSGWLATF